MTYRYTNRTLAAVSTLPLLLVFSLAEATAQQAAPLPELKVEARRVAPQPRANRAVRRPAETRPAATSRPASATPSAVPAGPASLTAPTAARAIVEAARVPGAVSVVEDKDFKQKQAITPKDVLDYVPGVFAQPKWGEDTRLSIRGSGLSRNYHLRGVLMYMDGLPINTADGYGDFQEIDPSAYRFVQVFKGGNGLALGANTLGGAINFVTPSGHDSARAQASLTGGSFGFIREQVSSGGVHGPFDYFINLAHQRQDGFRDHSGGSSVRGSANIGYRFNENAETRFYLNANTIRQRIPGEVDRWTALHSPRTPAGVNVANNWQRNVDSFRIGNKTTLKFDTTTVEFGGFYVNRHLMHPIFEWLDYKYNDYGAFARLSDDRKIGGYRNRFLAGVQLHNGSTDALQYVNGAGATKGPLSSQARQHSNNINLYGENAFYVRPDLSLVTGVQVLLANRKQDGVYGMFPWTLPATFNKDYTTLNPKVGVVYDLTPKAQIFANVSRSAEVPTFGQGMLVANFTSLKVQRATTFEIGTRGREEDYTWDVTAYHSRLNNEFQCVNVMFGACSEENTRRTVHQGIEAGFGAAIWKSAVSSGDKLWFNASYTFNDFRFRNDAVWGNNQLPGVPRHYVRAELLYKHPSGFFIGPNVEWAPEAPFVDNTNTTKSAAYALLGARMGYDSGKMWSAFIEGKNLTNRKYISSANVVHDFVAAGNPNLYNPGNGLSVIGGVNVKW
ncbi:MAG: TonB-dependent receptor [Rhizobiales bacterium PAR1]|nr:MAG: TonB-dependent receptor [Rhizobiales bacterium PAR1]